MQMRVLEHPCSKKASSARTVAKYWVMELPILCVCTRLNMQMHQQKMSHDRICATGCER